MKTWNSWFAVGLGVAVLSISSSALAEVRFEGDWSSPSPKVSLHLEAAPKQAALAELSQKAGWNLIVHDDALAHSGPISLDVTDASAKDVLESMLADGSFVARRRGEGAALLEISGVESVTAPTPPTPSRQENKRDRAVLGQNLRIEKDEVVSDVSVTGGSADIYGTVDGDLLVTGGSVIVHEGGHITGDTLAVGGRVHVEKGGRVDGDSKVIGGVFTREDNPDESSTSEPTERSLWSQTTHGMSNLFGNFAFLFVLGALFLATAPERMQRLRTAVAANPLASVAYGMAGLLGSLAAIVVLCVTVIGIPFALLFMLLLVVAVTGALAASLTTAGGALLQHRTQNLYVHLALGAALFALCGVLPWIGGWLQFGAVLAAFGILVTTRVAGFVIRKPAADPPSSGLPYR